MFRGTPAKLHDCLRTGTGSDDELFVVEGDSASKNVVRVRDDRFQAVLPMQGKPMNARRANKGNVARNGLFHRLIEAIGAGWDDSFDLTQVRYDRILLLFDPDADGIHCGALMLMFFHRWMPQLLDAGRIESIQPPLYELSARRNANDPPPAQWRSEQSTGHQSTGHIHAYSDDHFRRLRDHLHSQGIDFHSQRYRGLASINADVLLQTCVAPTTRNSVTLTTADAESAIRIFSGQGRSPIDH